VRARDHQARLERLESTARRRAAIRREQREVAAREKRKTPEERLAELDDLVASAIRADLLPRWPPACVNEHGRGSECQACEDWYAEFQRLVNQPRKIIDRSEEPASWTLLYADAAQLAGRPLPPELIAYYRLDDDQAIQASLARIEEFHAEQQRQETLIVRRKGRRRRWL